jgi:hypothetical protein
MPDYGFGRCDGHHEMVDFRLTKKRSGLRLLTSPTERAMQKKAPGVPGL